MTGQKRSKGKGRKAKPVPSRTLEQVALDEFAGTGDVTGLGVLADWYDENDRNPADAAQLRAVAADPVKAERVRFFYRNAGYHTGGDETEQVARFRCGLRLAAAEEWYDDNAADDYGEHGYGALRFMWHEGGVYDHDYSDMPETSWVCVLQEYGSGGWQTQGGIAGVTFGGDGAPWGDPYKRVIEAEMAAELMPDSK
jgi:hypothetical protein